MHSWRVLILPYMENKAIYKQYNFNEPWDGPNNKKLLASRPSIYACSSDDDSRAPGATCTNYVAVVGTNAAWSGGSRKSLTSDVSTTIMLVEVAGANIQWTEPRDVSLDALLTSSPGSPTVSSEHFPSGEFFTYSSNPGANVAFADGHVSFLPGGLLASDRFRDLLTVGGFREENLRDAGWIGVGRHIHWSNCTAFAVWLASTGWLLVRAVRSRKKAVVSAVE
jgi:prepilin-type processing-associated H-X9-DG protein